MKKKNAAIPSAAKSAQPMTVAALLKQARKSTSYPGTQQNLYTYSELAWNNYLAKEPNFAEYSTKFTKEMGMTAKAAITAAAALPSYEALSDAHTAARNLLIETLEPVLSKWQDLKDYSTEAFSATDLPSKLKAAGSENYRPAASYSWDSAAELIRMATLYMTTNSVALLANDNMPAGFPEAFAAAGTAFSAQRQVFIQKEKEARDGIAAKFDANEAVYVSLVMMTNAGKAIYRKDALERRNFTISSLKKEVRGNSASGIKGFVTTGESPAVALAGVLIFDQNDPERFTTSAADGSFEFKIPSGKQKIQVALAGFVPQTLERMIDVGTMHRQSFSMVAEPVPVVEASPAIVPQDNNSDMLSTAMSGMSNGVAAH